MWSVVIPLKKIGNNVNVLQTSHIHHLPLYNLSHCTVEMLYYLHFHVLLGGEVVDSVFLQQFTHVPVIEFLTLVHLKFDGRSHMFKHSSQSVTQLFPSLAPQRYEQGIAQKDIYYTEEESDSSILMLQRHVIYEISLVLIAQTPCQNLPASESGIEMSVQSVRMLTL